MIVIDRQYIKAEIPGGPGTVKSDRLFTSSMTPLFLLLAGGLAVTAGVSVAAAQGGPEVAAESVTIRPNTSRGRGMMGMGPDGRFVATNATLRILMREAYQVQDFQIVGGPSWIASERFDVVVTVRRSQPAAPGGAAGATPSIIREVLVDRFKLKARVETRTLPMYELVLAESDGRPGPRLRASKADCPSTPRDAPPAPTPPGERPMCGMRVGPGSISAGSVTMSRIATGLSALVGRVVVDRSGLEGTFDADLTWAPERPGARPGVPPGTPSAPVNPSGPSLFAALRQQLGLELNFAQGPVDVTVIESIERPAFD